MNNNGYARVACATSEFHLVGLHSRLVVQVKFTLLIRKLIRYVLHLFVLIIRKGLIMINTSIVLSLAYPLIIVHARF